MGLYSNPCISGELFVYDSPQKHAIAIICVGLESGYRHREPLIICFQFPFLGIFHIFPLRWDTSTHHTAEEKLKPRLQ